MRAKESGANDEWHLWCRLCAKEDTQNNISIFFKEEKQTDGKAASATGSGVIESDLSLVAAIEKYFSVNFDCNEELPKMICTGCFSRVTSMVNFSDRIAKVQQMFFALQKSDTKLDFHSLRLKYGLLDEKREQMPIEHQSPEVHYFVVKPKIELEENVFDAEVNAENPLETTRAKFEKKNVVGNGKENAKETDDDDDEEDSHAFNDKVFENETENESDDNEDEDFAPPKDHIIVGKDKNEKPTKIDKAPTSHQENTPPSKNRQCRAKRKQISKNHDNDIDSSDCDSIQNSSILACAECPRRFKRSKHFHNHMERKHSQTTNISLPKFPCGDCSRVFSKRYVLARHAKTHLPVEVKRSVPCTYCEKKFTTTYSMQSHIRYIHNQERSLFICDECGVILYTNVALKEHMELHTDNPQFVCEVCKKVFTNNTILKKHKETHDSNKHTCPECGLQLNSRATLKEHMIVHSDEMKYKCDHCGNAFKRAKTLKNHLILHTGLRPYSCEFCGRSFTSGANCRSHKKKAHPEELAALEAAGVKAYTHNIPNLKTLKAVCKKT